MEEIRKQMKQGNSALSSQFAALKKGIATLTDEARRTMLEEKHKQLLNEAGETFGYKNFRNIQNKLCHFENELAISIFCNNKNC